MFEEVYFNKKYQAFIYSYNCLIFIISVAMIVMQYSQKEYMSIFSGMLGVKWLFYMYNYYITLPFFYEI